MIDCKLNVRNTKHYKSKTKAFGSHFYQITYFASIKLLVNFEIYCTCSIASRPQFRRARNAIYVFVFICIHKWVTARYRFDSPKKSFTCVRHFLNRWHTVKIVAHPKFTSSHNTHKYRARMGERTKEKHTHIHSHKMQPQRVHLSKANCKNRKITSFVLFTFFFIIHCLLDNFLSFYLLVWKTKQFRCYFLWMRFNWRLFSTHLSMIFPHDKNIYCLSEHYFENKAMKKNLVHLRRRRSHTFW